jgi:hypothetical protein
VFEVPNRLPLDGCIPAHAAPFDYSIVVVAPSKTIKMTAPDENRHNMWLTALQYLVDSTRKVDDASWPDVLAARLALLTHQISPMFDEPLAAARPSTATDRRVQSATDKPLPPSPRDADVVSPIMRAPSVPRFSIHAREDSGGHSTTADSEALGHLSDRGSKAASSIRSQKAEPYTPSDEQQQSNPRAGPSSLKQPTYQTKHERSWSDHTTEQMDAVLDRLPGM